MLPFALNGRFVIVWSVRLLKAYPWNRHAREAGKTSFLV